MKGFRIEVLDEIGWVGINLYAGCAMNDAGLPAPELDGAIKHKHKFYFTQAGWKNFGKRLISIVRRRGKQTRVIIVKMERPLYKDKWQFVQ